MASQSIQEVVQLEIDIWWERGNMKTIGPVYRNEFIERKRQQLERLVSLKGSLTDAEVIALSQELDRYILAVQDSLSEISA
jgi:hypothetical protein